MNAHRLEIDHVLLHPGRHRQRRPDATHALRFAGPGRAARLACGAAGRLQRDAGWADARGPVLRLAADAAPCAALVSLAAASDLTLPPGEDPTHGLSLDLVGVDGSVAGTLTIPAGLG